MRHVVRSKTYFAQLNEILVHGAAKFGTRVVEAKLARLDHVLEQFLAAHPNARRLHQKLGLRVYPISQTPFVVIYDFNDQELRVHFIFHHHADLRQVDPATVEW